MGYIRQDLRANLAEGVQGVPSLFAKESMQQALKVLTLPVDELSGYLTTLIEQNPLLSWEEEKGPCLQEPVSGALAFDENDFSYLNHWEEGIYLFEASSRKDSLEATIPEKLTGYEELLKNFKEITSQTELVESAEQILGNLNRRGLLEGNLAAGGEKALAIIQRELEPKGLACSTLQDCFLIQLEGKEKTEVYLIVKHFWQDLIEGRWDWIGKKFSKTKSALVACLREALVCPLFLNQKRGIQIEELASQVDLEIVMDGMGEMLVRANEESLPKFGWNRGYLLENSPYIRSRLKEARWVLKNLAERRRILEGIGEAILKENESYFRGKNRSPSPLSPKEVGKLLSIHPSTLYRAIKNKWITTPREIVPLNFFFSRQLDIPSSGNPLFAKDIEKLIVQFIKKEDPQTPLTDQALVQALKKQGITLSRRAVATYRNRSHIPSSRKRNKIYSP